MGQFARASTKRNITRKFGDSHALGSKKQFLSLAAYSTDYNIKR
jgi:hypothetical protein